ncbi:SET domain-containing protein [Mollisia scopiformis]|uniref:SET domain-containing protein n=1 Tax=Mollisia scopiformis TaxID=149040 RepID=A0A194XDZ9_MOLSC|nr:SET domain-containing protein [Mollisia scopiformis]KUJ18403.1 SET domain-containing protein [Mollisia scopiformis]
MQRLQLPINALPAWAKLNDVNFLDISVHDLGSEKGYGLVTSRALSSEDVFDVPTLLIVPHDLILSAEAVEEHAKVDAHFKQLLEVFGGKSTRGDVMLFLLMQISIASHPDEKAVGLSNPWTEYVKMLPGSIPVPTMWSEEERLMLVGTSLETPVTAKMASLLREYEGLREATVEIPWCKKYWWDYDSFQLNDWILLDAWYRSRCLELPNTGESMIPCVDMVNHHSRANSYYEPTSDGVALLLRPNKKVDIEEEISISYGTSKSEAEMLFSYGFIDEDSNKKGLTLTLEPLLDDPLGKAKAAAFKKPPTVRVSEDQGALCWESPFLYLMCLNEEDGLEFKVLQQTDGSRSQLRVFWQGSDVTNATDNFESLTANHELKDVFKLRAVALLQDLTREQLGRLHESEDMVQSLAGTAFASPQSQGNALQLRQSETVILENMFGVLEMQKNKLLESDAVLRYLGSMEDEERPEPGATNDEEDFS